MKVHLLLAVTLAACLPAGSVTSSPGELRGTPLSLTHAGGMAEVPDIKVAVRFENTGATDCVLNSYQLRWAGGPSSTGLGGSKRCDAAAVTVPAHGAIETTCTIASTTQLGGSPGMTIANTTIDEVQSTCTLTR